MQISDTPATQTEDPAPRPQTIPSSRKTSSGAAETASSLAMWLRSCRRQSSLRPRSHVAHGSETRRTTTAPRKRWCSCAILTEPPVTQTGRDDAAVATSAELIPHSETYVLAIPSRTVDSPDIRMQRPMACPPVSNLLRARCRCPQRSPLRRQPATKLSHPGHRSHGAGQAVARRASPSLRDGTPALRCLSLFSLFRLHTGRPVGL